MRTLFETWRRQYRNIPILSIAELRIQPEAGDWDSGIYFLWNADELQYIGKSKQICMRIASHQWANIYGKTRSRIPNMIPFDRHTCVALSSDQVYCEGLAPYLQAYERAYIANYKTPYNFQGQNPGT